MNNMLLIEQVFCGLFDIPDNVFVLEKGKIIFLDEEKNFLRIPDYERFI